MLSVSSDQWPRPVAVRDVVLHSAVTDTDEVLTLESSGGYVSPSFTVAGWPISVGLQPYLDLTLPIRRSSALEVLEGELNLVLSEGTTSVRIGPISDWVGKRIEHPGLEGLMVRLESVDSSQVEIRLSPQADELIQEVCFENARGQPVPYHGGSYSYTIGNLIKRTYKVDVGPDDAIVFEVHQNPKTSKVPFSFRDVPLP